VKLTIYWKMMIGFGVIICLMVAVSGYVLLQLNTVSKTANVTLYSDVHSIDLAKQMQTLLYDEERDALKFLIAHDDSYYVLFDEGARRFDNNIDTLVSLKPGFEELEIIYQIQRGHQEFAGMMVRQRKVPPRMEGEPSPDQAGFDSLEVIHASLSRLITINQGSISQSMVNIETTTSRSLNLALIVLGCTVAAAVAAALLIALTINRPIRTLIRGTEQIAAGSFDPIHVSSNDEIALLADAFNKMSDKLRKINELKAEMMQQISHELRTPLQAMLAAHYLLSEQRLGPLNDEQQQMVTSLRKSIDKLTNFSNQFLDVAKIEAGMMEYKLERTDLLAIVRTAIEDARLVASRKSIALDLTATDVPPIMADPDKISQVITNLLSNAIKYTEKGGSIIVNVSPCENGVRMAVQDSGVGIAPEDAPRIFTKFYQAKNARKATTKGTGLGLALVKALAEGHGGRVSVTSTVGVGSTFVVELPAAPDDPGVRRGSKLPFNTTAANVQR